METKYWKQNKLVCGIDEAGRGPLFGSMFVAGVVLPVGFQNEIITDSKKMTPRKREEAEKIIRDNALFISVKEITPEMIDAGNITTLTREAAIEISKEVNNVDLFIIDWIKAPMIKNSISPAKAESLSINVAAASIIAKTARDRYVLEMDLVYPEYDLKNNKGYGTKKHIEIISKVGLSDKHRSSFKIKKNI